MPADPYFTRDLLKFLSELRSHNDRDWFQKNKERYEECVRDPVLRFIADLAPRLDCRQVTGIRHAAPQPQIRGICARRIGLWQAQGGPRAGPGR